MKRNSVDLTNGPLFSSFLKFALPIFYTDVLQRVYSLADTMIAGKFAGKGPLAAIGMTAAPTSLMLAVFSGLAIGSNVVCANSFGAGDKEAVEKTVHTSVALSIVIGVPLMVIGWMMAIPFLKLMDTPDDIIKMSAVYMRIIFTGVPMTLLYNFCAGILRAVGDTKRPFYILVVCGFINVAFNVVFVTLLKWGVSGIAWATVISQTLSAFLCVIILAKEQSEIKLDVKKIGIYKRELHRIIVIGLPAGINGMLANISHVVLQTATNSFGTAVIAANNVAGNIEGFCTLTIYSAEAATVSFVGQNMGAKKYDRVFKICKISIACAMISCALISLFVYANGNFFTGLFTDDSVIIKEAIYRMRWVLLPYFIYSVAAVLAGALRGMGNAVWPAVSNLMCVCVFRVIWINTVWRMNPTLDMIYIVYPVAWILAGVVLSIMFLTSKRKLLLK